MADKSAYEAGLANAVHEAERAFAAANAAPASAGRIERINQACGALSKAEAEYENCRRGTAYK